MRKIFLAMAILLGACASPPTDLKLDTATHGAIVGTLSYESGLARFFLVAKSLETGKLIEMSFGCSLFPCAQPEDDPRYSANRHPTQRGGAFAVGAQEGNYVLLSWRAVRGGMVSRSASEINIPFQVSRGAISYIGNLHFDRHWENVTLRDASDQDLSLIRDQFLSLRDMDLAFSIAPNTVIRGVGGEYKTMIESRLPIYIPVRRK